jgi:Asp-tRNA(Asn)/Glu-tRNA(Gln) amidotransferase B subunit
MTTIWKYKDKTIYPGRHWVDDHNTRHPKNWTNWTEEQRVQKEVKEYVCDPEPDSRLYTWTTDTYGKITKTEKSLSDARATLTQELKDEQRFFLAKSDSWIIRKVDKGTAIPSNIQTWRDAIRAKSKEMENAIDTASNIDAIADLILVIDEDGNKTGILYDWPELVE